MFYVALYLIVLINADVLTTHLCLGTGHGREANPLVRWCWAHLGYLPTTALKIFLGIATAFYLYYRTSTRPWDAGLGLIGFALFYTYVVVHNYRLWRTYVRSASVGSSWRGGWPLPGAPPGALPLHRAAVPWRRGSLVGARANARHPRSLAWPGGTPGLARRERKGPEKGLPPTQWRREDTTYGTAM